MGGYIRFRIGEECLNRSGKTQDAEDDEHFVCDIPESGRDEKAQSEVEEPVAHGGDAHAGTTCLETPYLCGVHPADGCESKCVCDDHEIGEGDDGICR